MPADLYLDTINVRRYCPSCGEGCEGECRLLDPEVLPEVPMMETPIPVKPGLYEVHKPDGRSPVVVTGNFFYTQTVLGAVLTNAKVDCYILSIDTDGYPVDMAVVLQKFKEERVREAIEKAKLSDKVQHRNLILPGLVDIEIEGWRAVKGPVCALELPLFLKFG
jgi:acetyl-CoA decarbonylase/synthase complex subunit gamma